MFERLIEQARVCYGHAANAKQKAEAAADPGSKASLLDMEKRWLALARSYQLIESLEGPSTATSALREAQERFRWLASIVTSSDDAIVSKNLDGIITSWNKGAERLFGYTAEEAVGKPVTILIPPDQHSEEDMILERIRRGERIGHYETVRRRKDGSSIVVSLTVSPVKNAGGRIVGASKIARDITERKRAEARERALMAELTFMNRAATAGELSASLAHELKQPLTGIVTRAGAARRWLAAENPNIDKARAALDQIETAGFRAADIIRNVSAVFKKDTHERKPVDVNRIIVEVMSLGEIEFKKHQIEVHTELDNRLPSVTGNRVQLQQVILNVVVNAIEAMHSVQPRRLLIQSGLSKPDVVHVSIADTGIGIDPANAEAIFKPLFTTKAQGMGMGLSICHSIIENHGGRIWASPGTPSGTIVQFELPTN
jgi:two-component system, LuxR family, sensor kinase FixL